LASESVDGMNSWAATANEGQRVMT